jgi:hypothetical protein
MKTSPFDLPNKDYWNMDAVNQYMDIRNADYFRRDYMKHLIANDVSLYTLSARVGEGPNRSPRWVRHTFQTIEEVLNAVAGMEIDEDTTINNLEIIPEKELDKNYKKWNEETQEFEEQDYPTRLVKLDERYQNIAEMIYSYEPEKKDNA